MSTAATKLDYFSGKPGTDNNIIVANDKYRISAVSRGDTVKVYGINVQLTEKFNQDKDTDQLNADSYKSLCTIKNKYTGYDGFYRVSVSDPVGNKNRAMSQGISSFSVKEGLYKSLPQKTSKKKKALKYGLLAAGVVGLCALTYFAITYFTMMGQHMANVNAHDAIMIANKDWFLQYQYIIDHSIGPGDPFYNEIVAGYNAFMTSWAAKTVETGAAITSAVTAGGTTAGAVGTLAVTAKTGSSIKKDLQNDKLALLTPRYDKLLSEQVKTQVNTGETPITPVPVEEPPVEPEPLPVPTPSTSLKLEKPIAA